MNKRGQLFGLLAAIVLGLTSWLVARPSQTMANPESPPEVQWTKTFGGSGLDEGWSVQQTADGGYIIAGRTNSFGAGSYDVYLIKTDSSGNISWSRTFGGTQDDESRSVQQTTDGGYIIVGGTYSFGAGSWDVYLIKTDASGNMTWSKTFGGAGYDIGSSVQQTADGGYIIGGYTTSFGAGSYDVYLIKTDASGNMIWSKTFGGTGDDEGWSVQQASDGGYIIGGATNSYGAGGYDVYLIKTNTSGNMTWSRTFGGMGTSWGHSVEQTADGGYVVGGSTHSSGGPNYIYLVKTDASGDVTWSKTFRGMNEEAGGFSAQQTADGGYIVGGNSVAPGASYYDVYLVKMDASGNVTWSKTIGGANNDVGFFVRQTADGGYIIVGYTESFGAGSYDIYLIKLSTTQLPIVTTNNATGISAGSAILNGTLTSLGSALSANVSFQWGLSSGNYTHETPVQSMTSAVPFDYTLYGLSGNTTYYFRAKAVGDGTSYGAEKNFTTAITIAPTPTPIVPPSVTTVAVDNITTASARLSGELTSLGSTVSGNVSLAFRWGLDSHNYIDETPPISTNATGPFSYVLTGLSANTTYYFSAWAIAPFPNGSSEMSFTTLTEAVPPPPFAFKWGSEGSGDGQFEYPFGVAVDAWGNAYVADWGNYRIQKFTGSGQFITKWGSRGTGDGQFDTPYGIAIDGSGNVYVADFGNYRIQKFTSSGQFITKWGSFGSGDGQFNAMGGIAIDAWGNVYVADSSPRIQKFTSSGQFIAKWGAFGPGDGEFIAPEGVAVDSAGNVYVVDGGASRVQKFTGSGVFITKWGSYGLGDGQFGNPAGIATNGSGNVYVTDWSYNRVLEFTSSGSYVTKWGSYGSGAGQFISPRGVAVGPSGSVYVADTGNVYTAGSYNFRIQVFGTAPPLTPPTATTYRVFDFGPNFPRLNGYLDSKGSAVTANVSFVLGVSSGNYTIEMPAVSMNVTGLFTWVADGLAGGTRYYFRAKAMGDGTSYGEEKTFFKPVSITPVVPFGDANGDGLVNALDITKIERIIVGLDARQPMTNPDANQDGNVNAMDITKVERIIAGLG